MDGVISHATGGKPPVQPNAGNYMTGLLELERCIQWADTWVRALLSVYSCELYAVPEFHLGVFVVIG
ncbi:hypothetical protein [uncultured Gimesia sp.]|uniref:hypothetical protein n=1 Tax=uncultured Gimesia sp. TaxID=1678688 RepID=UPI002634C51E|nr:hypothetical protein [uncultured Gimesia sp.]